jgi:hypothetical protein
LILDTKALSAFVDGDAEVGNVAWIAALALKHRLPVLSRDQHFDVVPDIERRSW